MDFSSVVRVKAENYDECVNDWSVQNILVLNQHQESENLQITSHPKLENERIGYIDNEKYQETINCEEVKQEITFSSDFYTQHVPNTNYQDKISYEELNEDSLHSCTSCGMYFTNSYSHIIHNLIHLKVLIAKQKVYICAHCPKHFTTKNNLNDHIIKAHHWVIVHNKKNIPKTQRKHKCLVCDKSFKYSSWFSHMSEVHCQYRYKCKKCDQSFKAIRYLKRHYMVVHDKIEVYKGNRPSKEKCPKCPTILDSKYALTTHLRNCHSEETFTCELCNSTLKCKAYLLAHYRRVHHNDGIIHTCNVCNKEFKSVRYLNIHMRNTHNIVKSA